MTRNILIILSVVLCTALASTATAKPRFAGPLADRAGELLNRAAGGLRCILTLPAGDAANARAG